MRGRQCELSSPQPLVETMPAVYRGDPMTRLLCDAFDEQLAPVFATLDGFIAYLDAGTTPEDMLDWLAAWIGLTFDGHIDALRKRELIVASAAMLPWRGTVKSIRAAVNSVFNQEVEIIESGGATASSEPDAALEGDGAPMLVVRLITDAPNGVDVRRLDAIVASVKPAHLPHRVEVVTRGQDTATPKSA
jgi:phage tail-like protein